MKDTRDMMVKDYDTCTDEELIARLRAGEREITDYLIDKYKSLVRTRARALYLCAPGPTFWRAVTARI